MYKNHTIAVFVPAYNEEESIGKVIEAMPNYIDFIIVVDDGSGDRTTEIAKEKGAVVLVHNQNRGVGVAIHTALKKALELDINVMVNMDADAQFDPRDINKIIDPIINKKADFVTASRFKDPAYYPRTSKFKFIGNKMMSYFISKICRQKFYDVSCGFRAYSKDALLKLNLFGDFTYTQESLLDLAFKNVSIVEVPVKIHGTRKFGKSKVASNLFIYAYKTLKIILRTFRDYKPFKLFFLISVFNFFIGIVLGFFLFFHYLNTGGFTPHKWAGFLSGFFIALSIIFLSIGFIIDMFARMRYNQEEILYRLKIVLNEKHRQYKKKK